MTVYTVHEDGHGMIAIAKTFEAAKRFLLDEYWIDKNYEFFEYCEERKRYECQSIEKEWGDRWRDRFMGLTEDEFADIFVDRFAIYEEVVYE